MLLAKREQLTEQHGEPAVAGQGHDLTARVRGLHADGLGQRVGHRPMVERPDQSPAAVHAEVARGPQRRRADVGQEDRVVVGEPVDAAATVCGWKGPVAVRPRRGRRAVCGSAGSGRSCRRGARRRGCRQMRQKRGNGLLDRADERDVDRDSAADVLAPDIDLDNAAASG